MQSAARRRRPALLSGRGAPPACRRRCTHRPHVPDSTRDPSPALPLVAPVAAIRFVLDDLFSSLSQEDRRALLHVRAAGAWP